MTQDKERARREAADWLILRREDPADPEIAQSFAAWLAEGDHNVAAWASMARTFAAVEAMPSPTRVATPRWRPSRVPARFAAGFAMAACLAIMVAPGLITRLEADAVTGPGETRLLHLADGSSVWLGPDSAVALDNRRDRRGVRLLSGQAWFEVAHDPARPFMVSAGGVTTRVLGTGFDVRRLGDRTEVAVMHGHVQVSQQGEAAPPHDLLAGDWLRIAGDHRIEQGHQQADLAGSWRDGTALIRNRSVAEVIDEIRPWYRGRIILTGAVGRERVTGVYDLRDPARALDALITPHGGTITRITPWLMIIS